ncbi:MAG: hypothetical protein AMXMBFR83_05340 [Phycisphaerae bacterium]
MYPNLARRALLSVVGWSLLAPPVTSAKEVLLTFDNDEARGPYADALGADGFQDGTWRWDGNPAMDRERPLFGLQSLVTQAPSPISLGRPGDLGPEATFAVHLRKVKAGVNTLFSNWSGSPADGTLFIAFDPSGKYERDGIFLRFHHWRASASGLVDLELTIKPVPDWSEDDKPHHLAVTFSRGTVSAYLDGTRLGQVKADAKEFDRLDLSGAPGPMLFGGMPGTPPFPLLATADDVLIVPRALTPDEIALLARQGAVASKLFKAVTDRKVQSAPVTFVSEAETRRMTTVEAGGSAGPHIEWTFEAARRQWSPMVRPVQHVGIPGYEWQTAVLWDGSLLFGPQWRGVEAEVAPLGDNLLHLCVGFGERMRFLDRVGTNAPAIRRSLEGGRLPVPTVESRDGDLLWRETVFAHLLDRRPEEGLDPKAGDVLVTHALFSVRNGGYARRTGHLWLYVGDASKVNLGYKAHALPELGKPLPHRLEDGLGIVGGKVRYVLPAPAKGTVRQHDEVPAPEGVTTPAAKVIEWQVDLAPGEQADMRVILPYAAVEKNVGRRLLDLQSKEVLSEVRAFWKDLLYREGQITTPDPFVNDYLVAVAGQMAQQVAYRYTPKPGLWMYKTSPNWYEQIWPCNEAKALPVFDFRGLQHINRKALATFIDMQSDEVRGLDRSHMGSGRALAGEGYAKVKGFLGNFREWTANPLLLSHGLGMWALAGHYRLTRDRRWLGEGPGSPLQAMLDGFDWVSVQRRRTMREENGRRVEHWGVLPAASAHDWLAGCTIFNDAFCIYGMTEIVRLLGEIGHPRAEEMRKELNDYRRDLERAYAAARDRARPIPLPDGRFLPYVPRIVQELNWERIDWTYTGYGPLRAGAWGALEPNNLLVDQALAFLEAGIPGGSGPILNLPHRGIADTNFEAVSDPKAERHWLMRHYVEYETMWPIGGHLFLARDDLPRFFEWLFNNLAVVLHHDWRVGVESLDGVPSCAPGDGDRWQLIRRMFINETGGWDGGQQELFLFQAMPRSWLRPGDRLAVRDMRTYFGGRVQLEMEVAADGDSVQARADLALVEQPTGIRMRLRSGDGRPLKSAAVNDRPVEVQPGDVIVLPSQPKGQYRIVGRFTHE